MTQKGYITKGISGWTVAFWNGRDEVRYLHGLTSWGHARLALYLYWKNPPDYQNGFCTVVSLEDR